MKSEEVIYRELMQKPAGQPAGFVYVVYYFHMEEGQWKEKLAPEQYKVLREGGTEAPFSGELLHETADGMYRCAACGNPLFASDAKFDSGTGWPSFDQALSGAVREETDTSHGMTRTSVVCAKCGSHLGHVFADGPTDPSIASGQATGKRYCMNSVCLEFNEGEKLAS